MNSGLVLLLVAALYTARCVNAVDITVKDTKKAVKAAWNLYGGADPNVQKTYIARIQLESGDDVVVTCRFNVGKRLDCMLPKGGYLLPESEAAKVGTWFKIEIVAKGEYRPPQNKDYGGRYVNLYLKAKIMFNYHIELKEKEKKNEELK